MLDIEIRIKRGSLTVRPSRDDQFHLEADPSVVPEVHGSTVVINAERVAGPVHAIIDVPVPSAQLDANVGRGRCTIEGIEVQSGDVNIGLGDLVVNASRGDWDINVGKGNAEFKMVSGNLDINVGMGRITLSEVTGTADINDGLGSVYADRCQGTFDVNAGKGDISWTQCQGGSLATHAGLGTTSIDGRGESLETNTGLGRVTVQGIWSNATVTTGSGDMSIAGRFQRLEATAKQRGNIAVQMDPAQGSRVEVSTDRGRIVSHLNLIPVGHAGPQRGQRLVGVIGDGRGYVRLATKSGDVILSQDGPADGPPAASADRGDRHIDILQQLRDGNLTVDEAEAMLESLERDNR